MRADLVAIEAGAVAEPVAGSAGDEKLLSENERRILEHDRRCEAALQEWCGTVSETIATVIRCYLESHARLLETHCELYSAPRENKRRTDEATRTFQPDANVRHYPAAVSVVHTLEH